MTFEPRKKTQELVFVCEIEPARRLEAAAWTQAAAPNTSCWHVAHPEGKPSRVLERRLATRATTTYAPDVATIAACQALASSWHWDGANERLYVHTSTGGSPGSGLFLVCSYFWERLADRTIVIDGKQYRPLLDRSSLPDLSYEAKPFASGGVTQTHGSVTVLNNVKNNIGYWDERLDKYVYEGKRIIQAFGKPGDARSAYVPYLDSTTGNPTWREDAVVFAAEDPKKRQA